MTSVRAKIKTHYVQEQGNRCCYCNRRQDTENHRLWDVEHIVPRSTHPGFMFIPLNLAVACADCNREKGDDQVLVRARRTTYPTSSTAFKIVHPHFDAFSDHIHQDGYVYLPKSEKGTFTIRACNLLRFAQKYINWDSVISDSRFEQDVSELLRDDRTSYAALNRIVRNLATPSK